MIEIIIFTILYGFIPLIIYFFVRRCVLIELESILPYIALTFISSFYEFVFTYLLKYDVKYWFIVYNLIAFLTIGYFFYKVLDKEYKFFFYLVSFIFFGLLLFVKLNWNNYVVIELSSYLDSFQTIVILLFSIFWFRKSFIELKYNNLLDIPAFYFISGLIIYYCGTMVLFLMSYSIYKNNINMFQSYLLLNVVLNFVLRTLLIIGIWKARVK
jgi:hypothetical protein